MNQPKISLIEAFFLLAFALISDLINWIPIINIFVTIGTLPAFWFYFTLKGVKNRANLVGNLIEFVPALSVLPAITAGILLTIIFDRLEAKRINASALITANKISKSQ